MYMVYVSLTHSLRPLGHSNTCAPACYAEAHENIIPIASQRMALSGFTGNTRKAWFDRRLHLNS